MATVKLKARERTEAGKQGAKRIRAGGSVPGVLYGENLGSMPVEIDAHDLRVALSTRSGRNVIIELDLDSGDKGCRAVIREMERHPVTREILHVDFQRISENKPVIMHVPIVLAGECRAVKEGRGILDHTLRELEIRCLPRNIPEHLEIDVTELEPRHPIHVRDIAIQDVEIMERSERPIVEVLQPTIYREAEEAVAAEVEAGAPVEGEAEAAAEEEGGPGGKKTAHENEESSKS